jgi:thiol-disulfide isomerase/thioredoxin
MKVATLSLLFMLLGLVLAFSSAAKETSKVEDLPVVEPISQEEVVKLIQERNGKVLLLNVWATWCIPCREEFPDLVKLAEHYKSKDVEIVGLSVDYADEVQTKIQPFLKQYHTNFPVYVKNFKADEEFINMLNKDWSGGVPATFIFDKSGKQRAYVLGKKNLDFFKKEIEKIRQRI